jgi:hypothetical protein
MSIGTGTTATFTINQNCHLSELHDTKLFHFFEQEKITYFKK